MEIVLDIVNVILFTFVKIIECFIENIPMFINVYQTLSKISPIYLLCVGIGVPTLFIPIVKNLISKALG